MTLEMNSMVWMDIVIAAIFSIAFAYFAFFKTKQKEN